MRPIQHVRCAQCHVYSISLVGGHTEQEVARLIEVYHQYHSSVSGSSVLCSFRCLECGEIGAPTLPKFRCALCAGVVVATGGSVQRDEVAGVRPDPGFARRLEGDVDLDVLRETLRMNGLPQEQRIQCWKLLLGYHSPDRRMREMELAVFQKKYAYWVMRYCQPNSQLTETQESTRQQISVDVPRTHCKVCSFSFLFSRSVKFHFCVEICYFVLCFCLSFRFFVELFCFVLSHFVWKKTHPMFFDDERLAAALSRVLLVTSIVFLEREGYFQGLGDVAMVLFVLFCEERFPESENELARIEADVTNCLYLLLEPVLRATRGKFNHAVEFTHMEQTVAAAADPLLSAKFAELDVDWMFFAFRFNVCFMAREVRNTNDFPLFSKKNEQSFPFLWWQCCGTFTWWSRHEDSQSFIRLWSLRFCGDFDSN
jgi:hypothetical protein